MHYATLHTHTHIAHIFFPLCIFTVLYMDLCSVDVYRPSCYHMHINPEVEIQNFINLFPLFIWNQVLSICLELVWQAILLQGLPMSSSSMLGLLCSLT